MNVTEVLIVDAETDGLLDTLTKVHSLVIKNSEGTVFSCHDHGAYRSIEDGLKLIMNGVKDGALVVMHNGIAFDYWALKKVYPWFDVPIDQIRDTLLMARMARNDIALYDNNRRGFPRNLIGSHALKAWGYRLGLLKGTFGEDNQWDRWTPAMQEYCEQDVEVTEKLWKYLNEKYGAFFSPQALHIEHWFAHVISRQEQFGYPFDVKKATDLYLTLLADRDKLDKELAETFPPWYVGDKETTTPKVNNKTRGITKGVPYTKVKLVEFNPGSRQHIADRLETLYGWKPTDFTETGQAKVDEAVLSELDYPAAKLLSRRFMLDKRIGQIAEGTNAWLKMEKNGRIHGRVNTLGAVTGRCTHSAPNIGQVPASNVEYGPECRALFHAPQGWVQVGCDASGLELRCLAHYMARWDEGEYAKVVTTGDVHTVNQVAAGLPTRDNAKTFIYGFLYGAGDAKIGSIVGGTAEHGKELKQRFLNQTPALKKLRASIDKRVRDQLKRRNTAYLKAIDGRLLLVRHTHAALNTLLQSAGAIVVKLATVLLYQELERRGLEWGKDWAMVAHVHDEYQLHVRPEHVDVVVEVAEWSFKEAGERLDFRCPLAGEAKTGSNWSETH